MSVKAAPSTRGAFRVRFLARHDFRSREGVSRPLPGNDGEGGRPRRAATRPRPSQAPTQSDMTIVSAANDRYRARDLAVLVQMREKATKEGLNVRIVSYNLGGESKCPDGSLPSIWAKYGIELGEFNFEKYPSHVANLHCYAWKPPIIDEVLQESSENTVVMWVDSGRAS